MIGRFKILHPLAEAGFRLSFLRAPGLNSVCRFSMARSEFLVRRRTESFLSWKCTCILIWVPIRTFT
jgi:hypothetical protein